MQIFSCAEYCRRVDARSALPPALPVLSPARISALAKMAQRLMVVVDALSGQEPRSSPLLVNLPSVRFAVTDLKPKKKAEKRLEEVINFVGLEAMRFLHSDLQHRLPQEQEPITKKPWC
jgi:hypothetical protein